MSYKNIVDIKGMHCHSCEILLEANLAAVAGVKKVIVSYKKGTALIEYDGKLDIRSVEQAVNHSGYHLGKEDTKHFFSRNSEEYSELLAAGSIFFVVYAILTTTGFFDLSSAVFSSTPGLIGVLTIGLTAGISTCMALIGGLVLGISSRHAELHPEATAAQKFRPHIFFNLGRLLSYLVLGGVIGLMGSVLKLSSSLLGYITVVLGILMLVLGMKLTGIFPRLDKTSFTLPAPIGKFFGLHREVKEYSHRGAFITGALTFFVPCGFTQAMQLYAMSTGNLLQGSLIMGIFALGTLPGIIGIGGITSAVKGTFARYFFKFTALLVILLAVWNVQGGLALTGLSLPSLPSRESTTAVTTHEAYLENGRQIVTMTQLSGGYSPNQFTVKKDIPVVWKIQSVNQYTCAAYIHMPGAGISAPLTKGENVFEFTPQKAGPLRFTCSMGMYSGVFNVTN